MLYLFQPWLPGADEIELEKKVLFKDKVIILVPKEFGFMPEEMLKIKYPSAQRPTLVYSDEDGKVNVAFSHTTSKASQQQMEIYKNQLFQLLNMPVPMQK